MLLSNHGPLSSRQSTGALGTFADAATTWPIGPATPYDRPAVAKRTACGSGLRIGEHTAWMNRPRIGSPSFGRASET